MKITNTAKRLITINTAQAVSKDPEGVILDARAGEKFKLLPAGDAVEVPTYAVVFQKKFIAALFDTGCISFDKSEFDEIILSALDGREVPERFTGLSKDTLIDQCEELGIDVGIRWSMRDMMEAIEKLGVESEAPLESAVITIPPVQIPAPVETPAVVTPPVETPAVVTPPVIETPVIETPAVVTPSNDVYEGLSKTELVAMAEGLGVTVSARWTMPQIMEAIDAVQRDTV